MARRLTGQRFWPPGGGSAKPPRDQLARQSVEVVPLIRAKDAGQHLLTLNEALHDLPAIFLCSRSPFGVIPSKRLAPVVGVAVDAFKAVAEDIRSGIFSDADHSDKMKPEEVEQLRRALDRQTNK